MAGRAGETNGNENFINSIFPDLDSRHSGGSPTAVPNYSPWNATKKPWNDTKKSFDNNMDTLGDMMGGLKRLGGVNGPLSMNEEPPEDTFRTLKLSLKDLYKGTVKGFEFTRRLRDGQIKKETREVTVQPGWKDGIPLAEALAGPDLGYDLNRGLKHIDGRNVLFKLPFIGASGGNPIQPGFEIRIPNQGMPIRKSGGKSRGDLRVRIDVVFPAWLNASQILAARQLKECMSSIVPAFDI
ncbi:hypothetical protein PtB15_8B53 [Puccinia triticina]|nr:hypothetical protein PtB15_8B53 [Puccinia triticina]